MTETTPAPAATGARPGFVAVWTRHPLTILTGVAAIIYGVGFAFGFHRANGLWVPVGAALLGVLFVASLVAAYLKSQRT